MHLRVKGEDGSMLLEVDTCIVDRDISRIQEGGASSTIQVRSLEGNSFLYVVLSHSLESSNGLLYIQSFYFQTLTNSLP